MRYLDYTYPVPKFRPYELPKEFDLKKELEKCISPGYRWNKGYDEQLLRDHQIPTKIRLRLKWFEPAVFAGPCVPRVQFYRELGRRLARRVDHSKAIQKLCVNANGKGTLCGVLACAGVHRDKVAGFDVHENTVRALMNDQRKDRKEYWDWNTSLRDWSAEALVCRPAILYEGFLFLPMVLEHWKHLRTFSEVGAGIVQLENWRRRKDYS